jgi:hypothetical protein
MLYFWLLSWRVAVLATSCQLNDLILPVAEVKYWRQSLGAANQFKFLKINLQIFRVIIVELITKVSSATREHRDFDIPRRRHRSSCKAEHELDISWGCCRRWNIKVHLNNINQYNGQSSNVQIRCKHLVNTHCAVRRCLRK